MDDQVRLSDPERLLRRGFSVTSAAANSGFYGGFIVGDPPLADLQSAAAQTASTWAACLAPAIAHDRPTLAPELGFTLGHTPSVTDLLPVHHL